MNAPPRIYLDHNASAPLIPAARAAMAAWLEHDVAGNASSTHAEGRRARSAISTARMAVARALGVPERVAERALIFTSGATEANALVLGSAGGPIVTTAAEHPSVVMAARQTAGVRFAPVDAGGHIDLGALTGLLSGAALCSIHLANNETGVLQDADSIAAACKAAGVRLHLDASQAFGRLAVDVKALDCDYLTVSSHKLGGPHGAAALFVRPASMGSLAPINALLAGGHQERGRRAGTENVLAIVGFGAAAAAAHERLDAMAEVGRRRDRLWSALAELGAERVGRGPWLSNTLSVLFPGLEAEGLVMALDLGGVAASTGSACTSGSVEASPVLLAMGYTEADARSVVRFSLGPETTDADIASAVTTISDVVARARREQAG